MIKFNEIEILKLLYIIIAYFVIREFDNYQLILVLLFFTLFIIINISI